MFITGVAKILSGFGHARILAVPDPVIGLRFGMLMPIVGAAELVIAVTCFLPRVNERLKFSLIALLGINILVYRIGLWGIGWHHPCTCMGRLAGALHLSDQAADNIMKGVLAYLLVGSCVLLFAQGRR